MYSKIFKRRPFSDSHYSLKTVMNSASAVEGSIYTYFGTGDDSLYVFVGEVQGDGLSYWEGNR